MARIETWFNQDLKEPVKVHYLNGNVFSADNLGNLIGVNVFDGNNSIALGGSVSGSIIRADGTTVPVTGSIDGNKAYIVLPQVAYAISGVISIVLKLVSGGSTTTLLAVVSNVYLSSTDSVVDPGTILPSVEGLIARINEAVASIPPDYSELIGSLANRLHYLTASSTTDGYARNKNGSDQANSTFMYYTFDVSGGGTLLISGHHFSNSYPLYIFYDNNGDYVSSPELGNTGYDVHRYQVSVPSNVRSIVVNGANAGVAGGFNIVPSIQTLEMDGETTARRYLFIGDSYCQGYSHDAQNDGWAIYAAGYMGLTANDYARKYKGGARFSANGSNNTFEALLAATLYPYDYFTDIVCAGGYNDNAYTNTQITTGISSFVALCKSKYPVATVHVGFIAWNKQGSGDGAIPEWETIHSNLMTITLPAYQTAGKYGASYMPCVEFWIDDSGMTPSDGYHPSADGNRSIATGIVNALLTGSAPIPSSKLSPSGVAPDLSNLTESTADITDNDFTVQVGTPSYKKRFLKVWQYIQSKMSSIFVSKTGDTMTGNLVVQHASNDPPYVGVRDTTHSVTCYLHVGSTGERQGIYSSGYYNPDTDTTTNTEKWLLYRDKNGNAWLNGIAALANNGIVSITRSGTTFTVTKFDGTTFTFDQQDTNTWRPVVDGLTSTSTSDCLSAYQGKVLNDNKVAKSGDTMTGALTVQSNITGNKGLYAGTATSSTTDANLCFNGALEIREAGRVGNEQSSATFAPRIGFHWGGRFATSLAMHSDGHIYFKKQNGTDNARIYVGDVYSDNYNLEDVGNHKVVMKEYSVSTTANSYVTPFGAFAEFTIPSADLTANGWVSSVNVLTTSSTNPAVASFNSTTTKIFVYSASAGSMTLRVLYIKSKD